MSLAQTLIGSPATGLTLGRAVGPPVAVGLILAGNALAAQLLDGQVGPLVIARHLFAIILTLGLLWLGAALGLRILRALSPVDAPDLEALVFATGLGLGAVAYMVLACGFLGLLRPAVLAVLLLFAAVGCRAELRAVAVMMPTLLGRLRRQRPLSRQRPLLFSALPVLAIGLVLLAVRALAPTSGYDALLYHLAGPRELLQAGRLVPLPGLMQANMPFTVNLLYLLGLAAGSEEMPNLLHLAFASLTALAVFSFGRRHFDAHVGWLAALIFLSAPAIAVYGPMAGVDFGWAFFDFLAVYAFFNWTSSDRPRWLLIAGLAAGLSLGSKYLGALSVAALGLSLLWRLGAVQRRGPAGFIRGALMFGLPAALVAAPWYLKNWLWLGSPVWPFLAIGVVDSGDYYARHMNSGRTPLDYLLLPLRLYVGGAVEVPAAIPPLALFAIPAYLLVRKHAAATALVALAGFHFVVWSQGIQTVRYLFPTFPLLSLVAAYVASRGLAAEHRARMVRLGTSALLVSSVLLGAGASLVSFAIQQPLLQLVGLETREAYLDRAIVDYAAISHLNRQHDQVGRVLLIGEARVFYHRSSVLVDQSLGVAGRLMPLDDPAEAVTRLRAAGVTHVLVTQGALGWLARFDPEGRVVRWWLAFEAASPSFLIPEFSRGGATVYRVAEVPLERSRP